MEEILSPILLIMNEQEYNKKISDLATEANQLVEISRKKFKNKLEFRVSIEAEELKRLDKELKELYKEKEKKFPFKPKINKNYEPPIDNRTFNDRVRDAYESGIDMGGSWTGTDEFGNS